MDALREILDQNQILMHKEAEEQEWHYYNVNVRRKGKLYLINKNQPLVEKIGCKFNVVGDDYVMTEFHYQYFAELIKLEQGNISMLN